MKPNFHSPQTIHNHRILILAQTWNSADAELREYYAEYILNDDIIGVESEVYKITI